MPKKFWWPTQLSDQLVLIQNFQSKIGGYAAPLMLSAAQVAAADFLCEAFVTAFNVTEQSRTAMHGMTQWRDEVFYGKPEGVVVSAAPVFPVVGPVTYTKGSVLQFFKLRDLIVASPGYTNNIGESLGIVGTEKPSIIEADLVPELKTSVSAGYTVNIKGSMQSMTGLRVEYARKGGSFAPVAFFTNLPGSFQVAPAVPGEPETGHVRAVYIRKNEEFGGYSPDYPVTVS